MPELISRMDLYHWQTPVFADVFTNEAASTVENDKQRLQARLIDQFMNLGVNVQIERSKTMPSYTVYQIQLKQVIDADTLREHIYHIETEKDWVMGYSLLDETHLQLLLRTQKHKELTLSQVISRGTFRKAPNLSSLVLGVNLNQQILVSHWEAVKHMLIVGDRATKETFIHSMFLTQLMFNTPSELRIAFVGENLEAYRYLQEAPHNLGNSSQSSTEQGIRLIVGFNRELQRRQNAFEQIETASLDDCNAIRLEMEMASFPRIILMLNDLNHSEWVEQQQRWLEPLCNILEQGAQYGIHLVLSDWSLELPAPFDEILERMQVRLLTRAFAENSELSKQFTHFHPSLSRFVDAFFVRGEQWTPLEIAGVQPEVIRSLVVYWRQADHIRIENILMNLSAASLGGRSKSDTGERPILPTPNKPSKGALVRATEQLASVLEEDELELLASANHDEDEMTDAHRVIMTEPTPEPVFEENENGDLSISFESIQKAQALATYLGWLGIGPLIDILGLSQKEAETVIAILQARQILDRSKSPTPYLRVPRKKK